MECLHGSDHGHGGIQRLFDQAARNDFRSHLVEQQSRYTFRAFWRPQIVRCPRDRKVRKLKRRCPASNHCVKPKMLNTHYGIKRWAERERDTARLSPVIAPIY